MRDKLARGLPDDRTAIFSEKLEPVEPQAFFVETEETETQGDTQVAENIQRPVVPVSTHGTYTTIRVIGLVIAVSAAFVSGINSFQWFLTLRPVWVAVPMALTMVGASVLFPDFGIILVKRGRKAMGAMIILSGVIATGFCMYTTIAALYGQRSASMEAALAYSAPAAVAADTLSERTADRNRLVDDIAAQDRLIASTQGKIDQIGATDTMGKDSQVLQARINTYMAAKKVYEKALAGVDAQIAELRKVAPSGKPRDDIYTFLARVTGLEVATVEFLTAVIPASFLEIVAPVMVAVVMFL